MFYEFIFVSVKESPLLCCTNTSKPCFMSNKIFPNIKHGTVWFYLNEKEYVQCAVTYIFYKFIFASIKKIPSPWSTNTFSSDKYRLTFAYLKNQDEFFCTNKTSTILYQSPMEESSCSDLKHHLHEMFCPLG